MKRWWRDRRHLVLSGAIFRVARFICTTMRLRLVGYEHISLIRDHGKIFCGWHGYSLIPANFFRRRGYWVIISHSQDGEMQTRIFKKFGYNIIRGSTGRGGARALIESIRVLNKGGTMAITVDGPRGPSGVVQEGVMKMAQKSGCALIPVGTYARPALFVKTWDRYMVPLPFAKAAFTFGEPIYVPSNASEEQVEELRLQLQEEIDRLQQCAKDNVIAK